MKNNSENYNCIYRQYAFSPSFPVIYMKEENPSPSKILFYHFHNCLEIVYCEGASKQFRIENKEFTIESADACLIPPYKSHASYMSQSQSVQANGIINYHYVYFNPEDLFRIFYPSRLPDELLMFKYYDSAIKIQKDNFGRELNILQEVIHLLTRSDTCKIVSGLSRSPVEITVAQHNQDSLPIRSLLLLFLISLSRHLVTPLQEPGKTVPKEVLLPALREMSNSYMDKVTTQKLADLCGLAKSQFLNIFMDTMHRTPTQYMHLLRVIRASDLLIETDESLLEIAYTVGFSSSESFSTAFESYLGETPSAWRKEKRAFAGKNVKRSLYNSLQ
jgi:AraC family transcriptional regulator, activator of mtrCDE